MMTDTVNTNHGRVFASAVTAYALLGYAPVMEFSSFASSNNGDLENNSGPVCFFCTAFFFFFKGRKSYFSKVQELPWKLPLVESQKDKRIRLAMQSGLLFVSVSLPLWGSPYQAFLEGKDDWTKFHLSLSLCSWSHIRCHQNRHSSAKCWQEAFPNCSAKTGHLQQWESWASSKAEEKKKIKYKGLKWFPGINFKLMFLETATLFTSTLSFRTQPKWVGGTAETRSALWVRRDFSLTFWSQVDPSSSEAFSQSQVILWDRYVQKETAISLIFSLAHKSCNMTKESETTSMFPVWELNVCNSSQNNHLF